MNAKEIGVLIKSRRQELQIQQQGLADLTGENINPDIGITFNSIFPTNPKTNRVIYGFMERLGVETL